jgi:hypothetical protein
MTTRLATRLLVFSIAMTSVAPMYAANFIGASGNWDLNTNWSIVAPATEAFVPADPDDGLVNRNDDVTVTVNSDVPLIDQFQTQNTGGGAGGNTITVEIQAGAVLEMDAFSRIGRTGTTTGDTSQVIMTGGRFAQIADDFHMGWDPPSPSTIYFEVSGGTFEVFDEFRIGQNDLGNTVNIGTPEETNITAPEKLEFHVKGSGATINVGELHFESNPTAVDPWVGVLRFSLDAGGTSKIVVNGLGNSALGRINFEDSSALALGILSANVPTNVTLAESLVPNVGTLKTTAGVVINSGDQISAGVFGGNEYFYNVFFDSNHDTTGTPGIYLANLQTMPAEGLPGDYNGDGSVDAADYTVWRNHMATGTPLPENDDTPGVGPDDYDRWKDHFGEGGGEGGVGGANVPEPTTLFLAGLIAGGALAVRFGRIRWA